MLSLVEFLFELIRLNTDAEKRLNHREAAELIAKRFEELDLEPELIGDMPNVIVRMDAGAEEDLAIVSHYDVVPAAGPWKIEGKVVDPFTPLEIDGKIYGRGSADDKSGIVVTYEIFRKLKGRRLRYNPVAVIVGGEEMGGIGIREVMDSGFRSDAAIILDSSVSYVAIGASGAVPGWIKVKGIGGHAGSPFRCVNPVTQICELITEMKEFSSYRAGKLSELPSPPNTPIPKLWGRLTFTILRAGDKTNVIPEEAVAAFDLRLIPDEDPEEAVEELYSFFNQAITRLGINATLKISLENANTGWMTDPSEEIVRRTAKAAKKAYLEIYGEREDRKFKGMAAELGGNDGYCFFKKGIPLVSFGAIREDNNIHRSNEFVYLDDIRLLVRTLELILTSTMD